MAVIYILVGIICIGIVSLILALEKVREEDEERDWYDCTHSINTVQILRWVHRQRSKS